MYFHVRFQIISAFKNHGAMVTWYLEIEMLSLHMFHYIVFMSLDIITLTAPPHLPPRLICVLDQFVHKQGLNITIYNRSNIRWEVTLYGTY